MLSAAAMAGVTLGADEPHSVLHAEGLPAQWLHARVITAISALLQLQGEL